MNDVAVSHSGLLVTVGSCSYKDQVIIYITWRLLTSQEFSRDNYSCLSPKSQSHGGVAWLLVCVASLSKCECGYWCNVKPPHLIYPSAAFLSSTFWVIQVAPRSDQLKCPPLYSTRYFDQKPVQTILAIIQQKDYFYPDSFISFVMLVMGICM